MYDELVYLADTSCRPNITVQVVPAGVGAHAGLLGGFAIASIDSAPGSVYMESPDQGQTTEKPSVVGKLSLTFDTLRAEARPRGASRDLIGKIAEERWTEYTAHSGARAPIAKVTPAGGGREAPHARGVR